MLGQSRAVFSRTLRRGSRGEDVRALQELLQRAGYDPGPLDGDFGAGTESAVLAFQRANNLQPDGFAGPLTVAALSQAATGGTAGGPPPPTAAGTGYSLHIGLNRVDPAAYPFPVPPLAGCVNDANDVRDIAQSKGLRTRQLTDGQATSAAVTASIDTAAQTLAAGDLFVLTYSGHGSQLPDTSGDESEDETWVLWDRQFLDDELYALFGRFRAGVRILLISDSCHSGTVGRTLITNAAEQAAAGLDRAVTRLVDANVDAELSTLQTVRLAMSLSAAVQPALERLLTDRAPNPNAVNDIVLSAVGDLVQDHSLARDVETSTQPRLIYPTDALQDMLARPDVYRDAKASAARSPAPVCSVLLISGCQDNQTSSDGRPDASGHQNGAFTAALRSVWRDATDHADLHARIVRAMNSPTQSPNYFWVTPRDAAFEAQRPFTV